MNILSYLHGEMVYKAYPACRMLQKDVTSLLKRFATPMVEHIFRFESLIYR